MIRLSKSVVGAEERTAVDRVLSKGFLGTGPETQAFEKELEEYLGGGTRVACVNTGTAAVHLALQAASVGPGDEVLVPTLTFIASFQAVSATGATPVACDIEEASGLIDLEDAGKRVTPRTKALLAVHYASACGDLEKIAAFARDRDLVLVEDAAHAFGCMWKGKKIGSFGTVAAFSYDGIKNITSGEGGAVATRDAEILRRVQDARLLGVEKDTEKRYRRERSWDFDVSRQGWRYHMSDVFAAIGRVQLRRFEAEFKPRRIALARRYREGLGGLETLRFFESDLGPVVPHIQPIRVMGGKRDALREALLGEEIETGIHYKPNHLLTKYGGGTTFLPVAEHLYGEILSLPLHPDLSHEEQEKIIGVVKKILA